VSDTTTPVFVVTGASSGIGEAIATHLAGTGARVLIGARTTESGDAAAARIRSHVRDAEIGVVSGDLSDMTQVRALAEQVRERTDRLDGLIHNAAEIRPCCGPWGPLRHPPGWSRRPPRCTPASHPST